MLIEKPPAINDVVTIKLTSGEELIATLVEENTNYIKVGKPRVLVNAAQGLGMSPYLFTVDPDRNVKISRTTIVVLEPTEKESASSYTKATSGLIL